jgi:hypothetical protein
MIVLNIFRKESKPLQSKYFRSVTGSHFYCAVRDTSLLPPFHYRSGLNSSYMYSGCTLFDSRPDYWLFSGFHCFCWFLRAKNSVVRPSHSKSLPSHHWRSPSYSNRRYRNYVFDTASLSNLKMQLPLHLTKYRTFKTYPALNYALRHEEIWGMEAQLHGFLTSALDWGEW